MEVNIKIILQYVFIIQVLLKLFNRLSVKGYENKAWRSAVALLVTQTVKKPSYI